MPNQERALHRSRHVRRSSKSHRRCYILTLCVWSNGPTAGASTIPKHLKGLDVTILGAGIGGLATAAALKSIAGIHPKIYECKMAPGQRGGYGLALWPNGLKALQAIDPSLHQELLGKGSAIEERVFTSMDETRIDYCDEEAQYGHPMLCVRWKHVHEALRCFVRAQGCHIHTGRSAVSVETLKDGSGKVRVGFVDPNDESDVETMDTRLLVGADGLRSTVRQATADSSPPLDGGTVWFVGVVAEPEETKLERTRTHQWVLGDGTKAVSMMPMGETQTYWAAATAGDDRHDAKELKSAGAVKRFILERFPDYEDLCRLVRSTPAEDILCRAIHIRPPLESFTTGGNVVLVGDAAHPMRPSLGQGANTALEDAVQLALLLRDAASVEEALQAYDRTRVERCATIQGTSELVARLSYKHSDKGPLLTAPRQAKRSPNHAQWLYNWAPLTLAECLALE